MSITHEVGPFAIVPLWVMDRLIETGNPEALRLYVQLHRWTAGADHSCYPSRQKIADACGVTTKTIDRYVDALRTIGALDVQARWDAEGDRTSNCYTLRVTPPGHAGEVEEEQAGGDMYVATSRHERRDRDDADVAVTRPIEPDQSPSHHRSDDAASEDFEAFWLTYGRVGPRKKALECWRKAIRKDSPDVILAGGGR